MKRWLHRTEVIVDKAITPCIFILLAVIIMELGFEGMVEHYHLELYIHIADYFVITVFVIDLIFKYMKTKHLPEFFKKYWLDILAVFPFFLMFRFYEVTIGLFTPAVAEGAETAQKIFHEGVEVEKSGAKMLREAEMVAKDAERLGKAERSARFARFLRPLFRIPLFLKAAPHTTHFYGKPTGEHHEHEYMPKKRK
jgi:hypothetical protein